MMYLKLLFLAAIASASHSYPSAAITADDLEHGRSLQAGLLCIVGGKTIEECCAGADASDAICTLLTCVNLGDLTLTGACDCTMIENACTSVVMFASVVPSIDSLCKQVDDCCGEGGATPNDGFNGCVGAAIADGSITLPDFASLLPATALGPGPVIEVSEGEGELGPVLIDEGDDDEANATEVVDSPPDSTNMTDAEATEAPDANETDTAETEATEAPDADETDTSETEATEAPDADDTDTSETEATEAPGADERPGADEIKSPEIESDANRYYLGTMIAVASIFMIFV